MHHAKVYTQATVDAPPMSVPHLDLRIIDGEKALLLGHSLGSLLNFLKRKLPGFTGKCKLQKYPFFIRCMVAQPVIDEISDQTGNHE